MNSDTDILIQEILEKSGAIEKCPACFGHMIDAEDGEAEDIAYGMATNAWKEGKRGFRSMNREEVVSSLKRALAGAPNSCPSCSRS